MTKFEYLAELEQLLADLPAQERRDAMNYYEEYFVSAGPDKEEDVIRELGEHGAIYYFHAKDTQMLPAVLRKNGVLDTVSFTKPAERAWVFRTLGYGHGEELWRQIFSMLKIMGYDDSISIEHEDGLMSPKEGLEKAVAFVSRCIIRQDNTNMWWA